MHATYLHLEKMVAVLLFPLASFQAVLKSSSHPVPSKKGTFRLVQKKCGFLWLLLPQKRRKFYCSPFCLISTSNVSARSNDSFATAAINVLYAGVSGTIPCSTISENSCCALCNKLPRVAEAIIPLYVAVSQPMDHTTTNNILRSRYQPVMVARCHFSYSFSVSPRIFRKRDRETGISDHQRPPETQVG